MQLKIKKGFDIKLVGEAKQQIDAIHSDIFSFKPADFKGIVRPKVLVNEGDNVKAGTPIFIDKRNETVKFTSPVSGEIVAVVRGEKNAPLEIKILADKQIEYAEFPKFNENDLNGLSKEQVFDSLLNSGVFVNLLERPFGVVPHPDHTPKAIFISGFDSHPLAPDYDFIFKGEEKYLQAGVTILQKLTAGKVHLSHKTGSIFRNLKGATLHEVSGQHPAGNVGVQIHHIDPINKGEYVWTTTPYGLQQIGKLFLEGKYDASKVISVVGSEIQNPQYYKVYSNTSIQKLIENKLKSDNVRFISGNVLTGEKIAKDGFLGYYHNMISVIPEGNYHEFLGWILPSAKKLSFHRAFGLFSFLSTKKPRVLDTNLHGEERAFVQTGVFEQVVPMDIYPEFLLKSILARDFEEMEALGIYEVLEEDFALCEFIDVSKMEIQSLLREGLDALMEA